MYTEPHGLVEVALLIVSGPFGSSQYMSCPWASSLFWTLCPSSFPLVSVGFFENFLGEGFAISMEREK